MMKKILYLLTMLTFTIEIVQGTTAITSSEKQKARKLFNIIDNNELTVILYENEELTLQKIKNNLHFFYFLDISKINVEECENKNIKIITNDTSVYTDEAIMRVNVFRPTKLNKIVPNNVDLGVLNFNNRVSSTKDYIIMIKNVLAIQYPQLNLDKIGIALSPDFSSGSLFSLSEIVYTEIINFTFSVNN